MYEQRTISVVYQDGEWKKLPDNSSSDMMKVLSGLVKLRKPRHDFAGERARREQLNGLYMALRQQIPNPSAKRDRASIVGGAVQYIRELKTTVDELRILVGKKRKRDDTRKMEGSQDLFSSIEKRSHTATGHYAASGSCPQTFFCLEKK
ncbi:hypothetical protein FRX31_011884 [Thalictrum thalictroides]|uniref:BHLH domain-containing protein n=1 Tax=Thalictrum thalictroides TaxID=46969 RepID=A0A7J6WPY7_THATH|nr:hypothetical protein FRX31_011884 [Thalictrum thalictroides]